MERKKAKRTEQGIAAQREVLQCTSILENGHGGMRERSYVRHFGRQAKEILDTPVECERGSGGEIVPTDDDLELVDPDGPDWSYVRDEALDTLRNPRIANIDASVHRIDKLGHANVTASGLDLAETLNAKNSAEKMLAHQLAAAHAMSMDLAAASGRESDNVERCRLANTSARLMRTFSESLLALQKLRNGGRQEVVVQHVQVTDSAQAVVAGKVNCRGSGGSN